MDKEQLKIFAEKYENVSFMDNDPSQFLRWYDLPEEQELAGFIAAMLSFGSRKQFIPKIRQIFTIADENGGLLLWIKYKLYKTTFVCNDMQSKFYRFYSYEDMHILFEELFEFLSKADSLGSYFKCLYQTQLKMGKNILLADLVADSFTKCKIVPKGKNCANKRIHMFLRWMVRKNSPVDLGVWQWYSPVDLIMPLDVHVMQQSITMGLLPQNAKANRKNALLLTQQMKKIWPQDPTKADYALFGLGASKTN